MSRYALNHAAFSLCVRPRSRPARSTASSAGARAPRSSAGMNRQNTRVDVRQHALRVLLVVSRGSARSAASSSCAGADARLEQVVPQRHPRAAARQRDPGRPRCAAAGSRGSPRRGRTGRSRGRRRSAARSAAPADPLAPLHRWSSAPVTYDGQLLQRAVDTRARRAGAAARRGRASADRAA